MGIESYPPTGPVSSVDGRTGAVSLSATYVAKVAAPTGVAATDTANVTGAITALPSTGGEVRFSSGVYVLNVDTITSSGKPVRFVGQGHGYSATTRGGDATDAYVQGGTVLQFSSLTGVGIALDTSGCSISDLAIVNTAVGTPTAGAGISARHFTQSHIDRVLVFNFYNGIKIDAGYYWSITSTLVCDPVHYGIWVRNIDVADSGDQFIGAGSFIGATSKSYTAAAALRWESGGGLKINGLKVNGGCTVGMDFALASGVSTTDPIITGNSVENFVSGVGIKFSAQGTGTFGNLVVTGNEIGAGQGTGTVGISVGASMNNGNISGNVFSSIGVGIEDAGGDGLSIGTNSFDNVTTAVYLDASVPRTSRVDVARQTFRQDNAEIVNVNPAALTFANVEVDYRRDIPSTTGATVTRLWTLNVGNYAGAILDLTVGGVVANGGTFLVKRRRVIQTDGAGVVTFTTPTGWTDITIGTVPPTVTISAPGSGGVINITIQLGTGGTDVTGQAHLQFDGQINSLRQGT